MTISNPGNVGIGTTDPIVKLEVVGSSKITDSLAVGGANIPSTYQLRVDAVKAGVSGTYDYQRGIFASVRPNPTLWTQPNNHSVGLTSSVLTDDKITATDTVSDLIGITSQYGAYT